MVKSVLLVDDDKVLNFVTANSFKRSGQVKEIKVAYDGEEALEIILEEETQPDFILLDIGMPKMNGFQFLDEYYKKDIVKRAKIAIYTSSIEQADKEKAAKYEDVIDFIVKPITPEKLHQIIHEL